MAGPPNLKEAQLDALREVANIGACHAATALSQLTAQRIMISVPSISFISEGAFEVVLGDSDRRAAVVAMRTLGDLTGPTALALPEEDARLLCDFMLGRTLGESEAFGDIEISTLMEAGNILGGAYLNALAKFMSMMLVPSVPQVFIGEARGLADQMGKDAMGEVILCASTEFSFDESDAGRKLRGQLLHMPDSTALTAIFEAVNVG
jgi:chemotaxis protein CheC